MQPSRLCGRNPNAAALTSRDAFTPLWRASRPGLRSTCRSRSRRRTAHPPPPGFAGGGAGALNRFHRNVRRIGEASRARAHSSKTPAAVEGMSRSTAWDIASVSPGARSLAERAASRAGITLEQWLDQAIVELASDTGAAASAGTSNRGGASEFRPDENVGDDRAARGSAAVSRRRVRPGSAGAAESERGPSRTARAERRRGRDAGSRACRLAARAAGRPPHLGKAGR